MHSGWLKIIMVLGTPNQNAFYNIELWRNSIFVDDISSKTEFKLS